MTAQPAQDAAIIRPIRHADIPAVAQLYQSIMRGGGAPAGADIAAQFSRHFLDGPFADPECPSLVYVSASGAVEGFGGRVTQWFSYGERTLRATILSMLMVRDRDAAPTAGARLLRAMKEGPQDITLSETAGDATLSMWRQLRGEVLDRHSFDFTRVLRPVRYAFELLSFRIRAARFLLPLTDLPDRLLQSKPGPLRWTGLPKGFKPERGVKIAETTPEIFAELFTQWSNKRTIAPLWPDDSLRAVIAEAMQKRDYGTPHLRVVTTPTGVPIGAILFHFAGKGPVRVTDLVHAPGQAGAVVDALFTEAEALGASSVRGRTTPQLLDALLSRRVLLTHEGASVIACKDPEIVGAFQRGDVHMNGLVGERWSRFIGDSFKTGDTVSAVKPNGNFSEQARPVVL